jgi:hypothetical protein
MSEACRQAKVDVVLYQLDSAVANMVALTLGCEGCHGFLAFELQALENCETCPVSKPTDWCRVTAQCGCGAS